MKKFKRSNIFVLNDTSKITECKFDFSFSFQKIERKVGYTIFTPEIETMLAG